MVGQNTVFVQARSILPITSYQEVMPDITESLKSKGKPDPRVFPWNEGSFEDKLKRNPTVIVPATFISV